MADGLTDGFVEDVASTDVDTVDDGDAEDDCVAEMLADDVDDGDEPVALAVEETLLEADTEVVTLGLDEEHVVVCSVCTNGALSGDVIVPVTV